MIAGEGKRPVEQQAVRVPLDGAGVFGDLSVPRGAKGLVLFAHGSGSSRFSPRNRFVARRLQERGLATLLLDLLTAQEEQEDTGTGRYRFDVTLLADRLLRAVAWTANHDDPEIGYDWLKGPPIK